MTHEPDSQPTTAGRDRAMERGIVAASLCNVFNGGIAWDFLPMEIRRAWLVRADNFLRELAHHEWCVAAIDEVRDNDR